MEYEGLYILVVFSVAVYFSITSLSDLSDPENQPRGYLIAQIIKAIGFWFAFFSFVIN